MGCQDVKLERAAGQRLRLLIKAVNQRSTVIVDYQAQDGPSSQTEFQPTSILHTKDGWQITGKSSAHDQREMTLELNRIISTRDSEEGFDIPSRAAGESVAPKVHITDTEHAVPPPYLQVHETVSELNKASSAEEYPGLKNSR